MSNLRERILERLDKAAYYATPGKWDYDDATRNTMNCLVAALRGEVERHQPDSLDEPHCRWDDWPWPCESLKSIARALGVEGE